MQYRNRFATSLFDVILIFVSQIIPAVIPTSREHLLETLGLFSSFASEAQVDIVDGSFVPSVSWPYVETHDLETAFSDLLLPMPIELDLMIKSPEATLDSWNRLAPVRIVVHIESTENLESIFEHRKNNAYKLGLALNNDTPLEKILSIDRKDYDYVELMGIDVIGVQGQPFDESVLDRIRTIKAVHPDLEISIDGSVNETTVPLLREAGADRFVVGSAILNAENPAKMYEKLSALAV